jgi:long-chain fatty acid transport protein
MSFNKSKLALAVAAAAGLTFSSGAFATNGILQVGNGMVAHGLGGAGLSNGGDATAGMDNPALIGDSGDALNIGWSMFSPDRTTTLAGTYDFKSDAKMFAIPQIAFTSAINKSMSWGIMAYALGGMNTDYRTDVISLAFFGGVLPSTTDLSGLIVAPTLSFKPVDSLSLGVSALIAYENFRTRNLFGSTAAYIVGATPVDYGTNEGSTMGYGVKLGADWKITKGISVGAVVQPKISMGEISYFKTFLTDYVPGFGATPFTGDAQLTTPNEYGIGGKFAVGSSVDIVADILYYEWTSVDVFKYFGWEDQTVFKLGAEFRPTDKISLRFGYDYGKSPIQPGLAPSGLPTVFANYPFPAISENHVTLGFGYKMDKNVAFNAYYLYSPKTTITDTYTPVELSMSQNAFGVGLNYQAK